MKKIKFSILYLCLIVLSCGSSEKVIMDDGSVYTVKGKAIYQNGTEVTESLTEVKKDAIINKLDKRLEVEKSAKKEQDKLDNKQEDLLKAQKKAEQAQKKLERELKEKEDAREAFFKAKKNLKNQQEKYTRLLKKGKLSPNDELKWADKLEDLKADLNKAEKKLNKL